MDSNLFMLPPLNLYRQYGTRESKDIAIEGRVQFDLLQVLPRVLACLLEVFWSCLVTSSSFAAGCAKKL